MYGWPRNFLLSVNRVYKLHKFITYDEFKIIYNQQFSNVPAESSFLKFKADIASNFGPVTKNKKYPPPYQIKMYQNGFFKPPLKCLKKQRGGQKIIGTFLDSTKTFHFKRRGIRHLMMTQ